MRYSSMTGAVYVYVQMDGRLSDAQKNDWPALVGRINLKPEIRWVRRKEEPENMGPDVIGFRIQAIVRPAIEASLKQEQEKLKKEQEEKTKARKDAELNERLIKRLSSLKPKAEGSTKEGTYKLVPNSKGVTIDLKKGAETDSTSGVPL